MVFQSNRIVCIYLIALRVRKYIPTSILELQGVALHSGCDAFATRSPIYILGLNPKGTPEEYGDRTVRNDCERMMRSDHDRHSSYRDEGTGETYQKRILHLFSGLGDRGQGVDPQLTPCSNLLFPCSSGQDDIDPNWINLC